MIWTIVIGFTLTVLALAAPTLIPEATAFAPNRWFVALSGIVGTSAVAGYQYRVRQLQERLQTQDMRD